jgi:hypothetical protein
MDRVGRYLQIVSRLIEDYTRYRPSHGQIETEAIVDPIKDHYEVMHVGWDKDRRDHGSVVHIDIIGGKVWIQCDGTSRSVAEELLTTAELTRSLGSSCMVGQTFLSAGTDKNVCATRVD